ncbi:hypothetical protein CAPTEDRAFT_200312 [Capitella teleta]|uniref:THAP-type domain-containing protein n=1 Tax=Capitella teleta TaxID=283909 RepID=R7UZR6_CAPTE|nr:hypothetical protein CAPTEDRAFT_200312 [Capitella teleta]|eukprot:ELU09447.1 hypothetical protein CAPTEDRAFT_200312 [Capitella teleta]
MEEAVNRVAEPSKRATLCSRHFTEEDMDRSSLCKVRLREKAIPSIFPEYPANHQPGLSKRRKSPTRLHPVPQPPPKKRREPHASMSDEVVTPSLPDTIPPISLEDCSATPFPPAAPASQAQGDEDMLPVMAFEADATDETSRESRLLDLERKLERSSSVMKSQRKKIKILLQKTRRLSKKVADLEATLKHLRRKELNSSPASLSGSVVI